MASYPTQAPSRKAFRKRQNRFIDTAGRTYVLPTQNDPIFTKFARSGDVDYENYERDLRKGLAFDPLREIKDLTSRVMMYIKLPTPTQSAEFKQNLQNRGIEQYITSLDKDGTQFPNVSNTKPIILKNELTGVYYEAYVKQVQAKRRDKRGFVILQRVARINKPIR